MININLLRTNPELVRQSQKNRGMSEGDVDKVLTCDKSWRALKAEVDSLRARRNKLSNEIVEAKKAGKNIGSLMREAKELPEIMESKEKEAVALLEKRDAILSEIPNIIDSSVPIGDASHNKVLKIFGKPSVKFEHKDHADILQDLNLLDTHKAGEVAASRFYYLKGDLVQLNYAIIQFALDNLSKKGFTPIQPPFMLRRESLAGAIPIAAFEEMIYKIDGEDLYLIGTSEHAINAYMMNEQLDPVQLPLRFAGISTCFRKEAGSHGKDTKGIFRVHQFEKIEQFVFCKPEDSEKEFNMILKNSEELLTAIGIPFRFVLLSSQDMGRVPTKTIDFEGYFPSQKEYRELGSCSNCTDYQARRSSIKFRENNEFKFVHTLNNTAIATERMMACIVDNFQQQDGTIRVPTPLQKYLGGKKVIGKPLKKK
jgi:seryl-tRNA synthetase